MRVRGKKFKSSGFGTIRRWEGEITKIWNRGAAKRIYLQVRGAENEKKKRKKNTHFLKKRNNFNIKNRNERKQERRRSRETKQGEIVIRENEKAIFFLVCVWKITQFLLENTGRKILVCADVGRRINSNFISRNIWRNFFQPFLVSNVTRIIIKILFLLQKMLYNIHYHRIL